MTGRSRVRRTPRPAVRRVVAMEVVSGLGDGIFWVGLAAVLLRRGVGAEGFALAALARLGPRALVSAPAGLLADRMDRRRLLVGLDLVRGALMAALAVAASTGAPTAALLVLVLVSYTFAAPYRPALTASLPLIAGEDGLSSANALIGTVRQVMTFIGPLLGALMIGLASPEAMFAANAVTFGLSALLLPIGRLKGHDADDGQGLAGHRAGWIREIGEGWREVRATRGLVNVTVLVFVMYLARGAELVLYVLVADQRLGLGASGIGVLTGAIGFGALCVLPLAGRLADLGAAPLAMTLSVAATALPLTGLAALRSPVGACVDLFILGAGVVVFEVLSVTLLQRLTRREMLGRVFGLVGAASNAGKLVGAMVAPALVALAGVGGALILTGGIVGLVGLVSIPGLLALTKTTRARHERLRPVVDVLAALGLFEGASRLSLERLAGVALPQHIAAGTVVLRKGEPADDVYVVREGTFSVSDDGRMINAMRAGDWFGEIGLLKRSARTATVEATSDAEVWRIPGDAFLRAMQAVATEPGQLFDTMSERLARSARLGTAPVAAHR